MENENASITIRLPRSLKLAIEAAAQEQDLTASQLVRRHFTKKLAGTKPRSKKGRAA